MAPSQTRGCLGPGPRGLARPRVEPRRKGLDTGQPATRQVSGSWRPLLKQPASGGICRRARLPRPALCVRDWQCPLAPGGRWGAAPLNVPSQGRI